jgi:hypothetical protein
MRQTKIKEVATFDSFSKDLLIAIEIKLANESRLSDKELQYLNKWTLKSTYCNYASLENTNEII